MSRFPPWIPTLRGVCAWNWPACFREYQGASVMVTHDRDEAYQLCDNLLLFSKGHVIAAGKTKDIFNDPGSVEAARLTGCKNISRIESWMSTGCAP